MQKWILFLSLVVLLTTPCHAAERPAATEPDESGIAPISLSELAMKADLVAIAQVKDTDYVYARSYPNEGSAFLKILIEYKLNNPAEEIIEVYEKGLHPGECYFENPTVLEEGRRFLVFLRLDPEDPEIYRGLAEGCALELFVTDENRYAFKYPVEGIKLKDPLDHLAAEFNFNDNYAVVSEESLSPVERDELLADGLIIPYGDNFKYTHGIDLTAVRNLISSEALKPRRNW
jgi:hypothetical protein